MALQIVELARRNQELGAEVEHEQRPDDVDQVAQERARPADELEHHQDQPDHAERQHRFLEPVHELPEDLPPLDFDFAASSDRNAGLVGSRFIFLRAVARR